MEPNKKMRGCLILFLMASFVFLSSCNEPTPLQSKWRDKDVVINGNDSEWVDCNQYSDEITQTKMGIYNDDAYVYMCVTTKSTDVLASIVKQGFIVWFNKTGAKDKHLGIRFPLVTDMEATTGYRGDTVNVKDMKILTSRSDKGKTISVEDAAKLGISVAISSDASGKIIYEIKMPLKKTDSTPYASGVSATNNVGIGFMLYTAGGLASGISGFGGSTVDMSGGGGGSKGGGGGGMDSRDSSFSTRDISSMHDVFSFFSMNDDDASSMRNSDVSIINAQGGGAPSSSSSSSGSTESSIATVTQTVFEVWANVTLASAQ
jgi:hypothetical protein